MWSETPDSEGAGLASWIMEYWKASGLILFSFCQFFPLKICILSLKDSVFETALFEFARPVT